MLFHERNSENGAFTPEPAKASSCVECCVPCLKPSFEKGTQYVKNIPAFQPRISLFCSGKENLLQNGNWQQRQRYFAVSKHDIQEYSSSSSSKPPWFAGMLENYWVQGWFKHSRLIHTLKWLNFDYHWLCVWFGSCENWHLTLSRSSGILYSWPGMKNASVALNKISRT